MHEHAWARYVMLFAIFNVFHNRQSTRNTFLPISLTSFPLIDRMVRTIQGMCWFGVKICPVDVMDTIQTPFSSHYPLP